MNSIELRNELNIQLAELKADGTNVHMCDTDYYIEKVLDSIIFHCLGMKEQIELIRRQNVSFFSSFSNAEKELIREVDEEVWSVMDSIWLEENRWCCDMDFEDEVEDWIYVKSIYLYLDYILEYAEEKYGVFEIID